MDADPAPVPAGSQAGPAAAAAPAARRALALAARAALAVVAAVQAEIGIWGVAAPRSFYGDFPGFGRHWVSPIGPYDEHLVRDYASAELGLAVLLVCAAIWFERRVVLIVGAAFLVGTIPHFAYHLTTTDDLPRLDNVLSLGGFALEMAVVAAAMAAASRITRPSLVAPDAAR
jgi:hypothetical protein